ncbi:DUF4844 domain-containing protein [Shewanella baltica]|uniref:DUF4844 domain-containing protein n=1 Tax=Shewanella baltica TaxID=62322 RepID=UPI0003223BDF|nr:DUF4844 domain-containing protein [Shewanella baltica]MCS6117296.1 DUF4844 domain-containing protein [Shewanella baltica]UVW63574.1 DUF4844 domain-containing protein [Shewanella baltica]
MKKFSILLLSIISLFAIAGNNKMIHNNVERLQKLEKLLIEKKFTADEKLFYPGAPSEDVRATCEQAMNIVIKALIDIPDAGITEDEFWGLLEKAAKVYKQFDSEEMDRSLSYMEEIMDIYGIESSGGRLNTWRYGFDPSGSH